MFLKLNSTKLMMTNQYRCGPKTENQSELVMKMIDRYRCGPKTELN